MNDLKKNEGLQSARTGLLPRFSTVEDTFSLEEEVGEASSSVPPNRRRVPSGTLLVPVIPPSLR